MAAGRVGGKLCLQLSAAHPFAGQHPAQARRGEMLLGLSARECCMCASDAVDVWLAGESVDAAAADVDESAVCMLWLHHSQQSESAVAWSGHQSFSCPLLAFLTKKRFASVS